MPRFAKKIELDDILEELFFSFLLNGKYEVPSLSQEQEKLISRISEQFLISGFILKSCDFNASHKSLVEEIKQQRKTQLIKQMLVTNDLNNIAHNLNGKGIEHVFLKGTALNADGIYPCGIRYSRDIDLLVRSDLLNEAYDALKVNGFRYLNPKTQDSTKYHHYGHHLPAMINENNTKLELHWRVTDLCEFKNCPLTEEMLGNRRVSSVNSNIFCPKIEMMIAHLIYHSFEQHRLNLGPIFLFDLAAIFEYFGKKWPVDYDFFRKLGVEKNFELCRQFVEKASNEFRLSPTSKLLRDQIFNNSLWLRLSHESQMSGSLLKTTRVELCDNPSFFMQLLLKFRKIKTLHQVSYYSPKFFLVLLSDILNLLKRLVREFVN